MGRRDVAPPGLIALFGPPRCGITSILACIEPVSREPLHIVTERADASSLGAGMTSAPASRGGRAVLAGHPRFLTATEGEAAVQSLFDDNLVYAGCGALIRVVPGRALLAADREATAAWYRQLPRVEARIHLLNMPYFCIHNASGPGGLARAAAELWMRLGFGRYEYRDASDA